MNEERDIAICELYLSGKTLEEIGDVYGLRRQRVQQILKREGYDRTDRPVERSDRELFLGVNVSESVKAALREEAVKRGVSMSSITSDLLKEMLKACGYPLEAEQIVEGDDATPHA